MSSPKSSRERILDGAAAVMRERGVAHATTKEIARAAGVSEALLYKVFADKADLFLAVLAERLPRVTLFHDGVGAVVGTGDVVANIRALARELLAYYVDTFPIAASVFSDADLLTRHRTALGARHAGPQKVSETVAAYLRAEQHHGRIPASVDPATIAQLLVGACLHQAFLAGYRQQRPSSVASRRFGDSVVATLEPLLRPSSR